MWGAIIGDIAGSIYEFGQIKRINRVECSELIPEDGFFSDDTILTVAIADAINDNRDYEKYLRKYGERYQRYRPDFKPYFSTSFSPGFIKWVNGNSEGDSIGNGAMMRVSPVGYMFNSEKEVMENARLATIPSHNSEEAVKCSQLVALIIYYARNGLSKEQIKRKLRIDTEYKPFERFNSTCYETIGNCLYALFNSNSFEESVLKVISYGGDTDTNACIVGSMAEALYGIDSTTKYRAKTKIPEEFARVLEKSYNKRKIEDFER